MNVKVRLEGRQQIPRLAEKEFGVETGNARRSYSVHALLC